MTIEDYLLGLWTNQNQAQSSPTTYATIFMEWKEIEGGFQSQNYYRTDSTILRKVEKWYYNNLKKI